MHPIEIISATIIIIIVCHYRYRDDDDDDDDRHHHTLSLPLLPFTLAIKREFPLGFWMEPLARFKVCINKSPLMPRHHHYRHLFSCSFFFLDIMEKMLKDYYCALYFLRAIIIIIGVTSPSAQSLWFVI